MLPRDRRLVGALVLIGVLLGVLAIGALGERQPGRPIAGNGWVAFTVEANDSEGPSDVYLVRPGEPERALIGFNGDRVREACPQFSPDGTQLAYLRGPAIAPIQGRDEIAIVTLAADGATAGTPRVLAGGLGGNACPAWSPDSRSVAFMANNALSVVRLDGSSIAIETGRPSTWGFSDSIDWSPDGSEVAFIGDSSIWIAPIDGGAPHRSYEADADIELGDLEWSPDGRWMVVTAGRFSIIEALPPRIIPIGGLAAPVELPGYRAITWSPDGSRLAAVRRVTRGAFDWDELVTMSPDGSDVRLVADELWNVQGLTWSPDGLELLYVENQGPSPGLLAVAASGDAEPRLLLSRPTSLFTSSDPSWQAVFAR